MNVLCSATKQAIFNTRTTEEHKTLNKLELVNAVADRAEITRAVATAAVDSVFDLISEAMYVGDDVSVKGFGVFQCSARSERAGRNPRTGEMMVIPAARMPHWRAHKSLKEYLNQQHVAGEDASVAAQ
jgi:DNA-binding protein HU-beta